jgi:hypothetical protein
MPRFHLNLLSLEGPLIVLDEEGGDYPGIEHAYLAAFNAALELWGQLLRNREDPRLRVFHITDASGLVVMTLPLREVLDVCRSDRPGRSAARSPTPEAADTHERRRRDFAKLMQASRAEIARAHSHIDHSRRLTDECTRLAVRLRNSRGRSEADARHRPLAGKGRQHGRST